VNHPPEFYRRLHDAVRALLAANAGRTGRIVITVHVKDGVAQTVAVDAPEVPRRWEDVT
jgi:VCBS repeat-containing protein